MKFFKKLLLPVVALALSAGFTACSDDDDDNNPVIDPVEDTADYHFDLWVALDRHGGMGRDVQTLVRSLDSLSAGQPEIAFEGEGTEVNQTLTLESIVKGAYYYQVPVSGDRFAKYIISNNKITTVAATQFKTNTYAARKYTHAWLDDNTLLIMAANGDATEIVWTKLNATDMTITAEGTLDLPLPAGAEIFTTSGILTYRSLDNKLFYFYYGKTSGSRGQRTTPFYVAVINPATMAVESNEENGIADEMGGSAYGELLQPMSFVDDNGNLYLAAFKENAAGDNNAEKSYLLKIPAGSTKFDKSYNGFDQPGKLVSVIYLGGTKALAYARYDDLGTSIDSYSHYYAVVDLSSSTFEPLKYNGTKLGLSGGRFSCRMAYTHGKAYIGLNEEDKNPCIYIYDVATGVTAKGAEMKEGYYFEQIRVLDNID